MYVKVNTSKEGSQHTLQTISFIHTTQTADTRTCKSTFTVTKVLVLFVWRLLFFSYMYDECIYLKAEKVYYAPNHMEYATLKFIITIIYCWGKMKY